MAGMSYKDAGVDIDAGDALVERIKPFAARTRIPEVVADVGGFAGLCAVPGGIEDPILVSGTDGVGTKIQIAIAMDVHHTIGIDLVAMCVNDIITTGARPLFFLDYLATGRVDVERHARVVEGIARGCELAGCALLGGETAEHPGTMPASEYDLAGFAVGVVSRKAILDGSAVQAGDVVIGLESDGLHSNGYSLVRKALLEKAGLKLDAPVEGLAGKLGEELLRPTRIYAKAAAAALAAGGVRAMCHITGGGLPGNVPRVLPDGLGAELKNGSWPRPPIFDVVAWAGAVADDEMRRTFNLGIGYILVVAPASAAAVTAALTAAGERPHDIGRILPLTADDRVRFV